MTCLSSTRHNISSLLTKLPSSTPSTCCSCSSQSTNSNNLGNNSGGNFHLIAPPSAFDTMMAVLKHTSTNNPEVTPTPSSVGSSADGQTPTIDNNQTNNTSNNNNNNNNSNSNLLDTPPPPQASSSLASLMFQQHQTFKVADIRQLLPTQREIHAAAHHSITQLTQSIKCMSRSSMMFNNNCNSSCGSSSNVSTPSSTNSTGSFTPTPTSMTPTSLSFTPIISSAPAPRRRILAKQQPTPPMFLKNNSTNSNNTANCTSVSVFVPVSVPAASPLAGSCAMIIKSNLQKAGNLSMGKSKLYRKRMNKNKEPAPPPSKQNSTALLAAYERKLNLCPLRQ